MTIILGYSKLLARCWEMLKQSEMQTIDRNQRSVSTRPRLGDRRRMASERNRGWLHFMQSAFGARCVFALFFFFTGTIVSPAGEPSLWKLQKLLASKRYVDLTHEFAPGIPRWPGFPNETRKTIYWYDKRPDTMGTGFFLRSVHACWPMGNAR